MFLVPCSSFCADPRDFGLYTIALGCTQWPLPRRGNPVDLWCFGLRWQWGNPWRSDGAIWCMLSGCQLDLVNLVGVQGCPHGWVAHHGTSFDSKRMSSVDDVDGTSPFLFLWMMYGQPDVTRLKPRFCHKSRILVSTKREQLNSLRIYETGGG